MGAGELPHLGEAESSGGEFVVTNGQVGAQTGGAHPVRHLAVGDPDRRLHPAAHRHVAVVAERLPSIRRRDDRHRHCLQPADRPLHVTEAGGELSGIERIDAGAEGHHHDVHRLRTTNRTHVPSMTNGCHSHRRARIALVRETLTPGVEHRASYEVSADMAPAHLPTAVLSTPSMIQLIEQTCLVAVQPHLDDGETTVGTHVCVGHTGPAVVGETVDVSCRLTGVQRRRLTFDIEVEAAAQTISTGTHERAVIDLNRFSAS